MGCRGALGHALLTAVVSEGSLPSRSKIGPASVGTPACATTGRGAYSVVPACLQGKDLRSDRNERDHADADAAVQVRLDTRCQQLPPEAAVRVTLALLSSYEGMGQADISCASGGVRVRALCGRGTSGHKRGTAGV